MAASRERGTTHVTFVCQRCAQPLKLNKSLSPKALVDIAESVEKKLELEWSGVEGERELLSSKVDPDSPAVVSQEELFSSSPEKAQLEVEAQDRFEGGEGDSSSSSSPSLIPRSSPHVTRRQMSRSSLETVSVIYDSLPVNSPAERSSSKNTLKHIQIASETFKMLSAHTDIDHPLCCECPEAVLDNYDQRICRMEEAKRHYQNMSARLAQEVEQYESQMVEFDSELEELREEEEDLKKKLLKTEEQRTQIAEEMERQRKREKELKEEEKAYWREYNEYQRQMLQFKDDQLSVEYNLHYTTEQLNRLKKTNVLNSAFHIWHNGHFGTINGLRLGRLQTVPVEWLEINAAWGQTAFLLYTLARMVGVEFERFKLVPYGNQSFIEPLDGKKRIFPLYSSAGLRIFTDSKFDLAMVAFLDLLDQLKLHIESTSHPHFMLPYRIDKDSIGDGKEFYSVKTQFNTPERWTKALKFILTNLRWALTWVAANAIKHPSQQAS